MHFAAHRLPKEEVSSTDDVAEKRYAAAGVVLDCRPIGEVRPGATSTFRGGQATLGALIGSWGRQLGYTRNSAFSDAS